MRAKKSVFIRDIVILVSILLFILPVSSSELSTEKQCEMLSSLLSVEQAPQTDSFKRLKTAGVNLNLICEFMIGDGFEQTTPLIHAIHIRKTSVHPLLRAGANPNAAMNDGSTPVMEANDIEIMRLLIKAGADVNARDNNGETVLIRIIRQDFDNVAEFVSLLLKAGANPETKNNEGQTASTLTNRANIKSLLNSKKRR